MRREVLRRLPSLGAAFARNTKEASFQNATTEQLRYSPLWRALRGNAWNTRSSFGLSTEAERDSPQTDKDSTEKSPNEESKQQSAETVEDLDTELPDLEAQNAQNEAQERIRAILEEKDVALMQLSEQLEKERKKTLSALADTENVRSRFARESTQTKKFAVQGFVQDLLGSLDNLDRAVDSVPEDLRKAQNVNGLDEEKLLAALQGLLTGVRMTQSEFRNVLESHGVVRYDPLGDVFDPNEHMARFELNDPEKEPGTIGVVTVCGYKMHDRIIRPAEVGVVRKAQGETPSQQSDEKSQAES